MEYLIIFLDLVNYYSCDLWFINLSVITSATVMSHYIYARLRMRVRRLLSCARLHIEIKLVVLFIELSSVFGYSKPSYSQLG